MFDPSAAVSQLVQFPLLQLIGGNGEVKLFNGEVLKYDGWETVCCSKYRYLIVGRQKSYLFPQLILPVILMFGWHNRAESQLNPWFLSSVATEINVLGNSEIENKFQSLRTRLPVQI